MCWFISVVSGGCGAIVSKYYHRMNHRETEHDKGKPMQKATEFISKTRHSLLAVVAAFAMVTTATAQEVISLDDERTRQLQELGVLLPNPVTIREAAAIEFAKPVLDQDAGTLEDLARDANLYSNLVTKITDEYNDYLRDNSRYDFVTEEVRKAPIVTSLLDLDAEFKGIRNQAYLNLGQIALENGQEMEALLLFNDAYRLSVFACEDGVDDCVRYQAEQYMKSLLGVEGDSYVYWQR